MDRTQRDGEDTLPKFGHRVRTRVKKGEAIAMPDSSCMGAEARARVPAAHGSQEAC